MRNEKIKGQNNTRIDAEIINKDNNFIDRYINRMVDKLSKK